MSPLLTLDTQVFQDNFGRGPFLVRHHLANHELFTLPRLVKLSTALPDSSVESNAGDVPLTLDPRATPRTGLSVEETIQRIQECRSWMVLKNVEQDPDYRDLLESCLREIRTVSEGVDPGMCDHEGFVFISSPGSVTPYHLDPEQNFLLQIRGLKTMNVFDARDRSILPEEQIERFLTGAHRNLVFKEEFECRAHVVELSPGLGVHVPVTSPHWVKNGSEVSISFSITFQTRASLRRGYAHRMNAALRRLGLSPSAVGPSPLRDSVKQLGYRVGMRLGRRVRWN